MHITTRPHPFIINNSIFHYTRYTPYVYYKHSLALSLSISSIVSSFLRKTQWYHSLSFCSPFAQKMHTNSSQGPPQ